jgi:glycosyltransferase involved in cell wall biosynthesis
MDVKERFESLRCDVSRELANSDKSEPLAPIGVTLLTGGADKDYLFGLTMELLAHRAVVDLIGSDQLDGPEFHEKLGLTFLNLRGDQRSEVTLLKKAFRVLKYYWRLICYAATAKPRIFHILWNNKFETFDRTLLMLYYKFLGKKIVLTAHNVNAGRRDARDSRFNRLTLRIQYRLADQVFVHTEKMKKELIEEFEVLETHITVIPYGINNAVPNSGVSPSEAKRRLGLRYDQKTILFFGHIRPYKGLEYLIAAFQRLRTHGDDYRLLIAGRPQDGGKYWSTILETIREDVQLGRILVRADFITDDAIEIYFKAADVLALPYRHIYQSGVLFLGYSFGLPALVADVGSLKDEIIHGQTGFVFRPEDPDDLAFTIERYFASDLFAYLDRNREKISNLATEQHSWKLVAQRTMNVYTKLLERPPSFGTKASL